MTRIIITIKRNTITKLQSCSNLNATELARQKILPRSYTFLRTVLEKHTQSRDHGDPM